MRLLDRLRERLLRPPRPERREASPRPAGPRLEALAPEYRVSCRIHTEFDDDGTSVQLVLDFPFAGELRFLDATQAEVTLRLLQEAVPRLRALERQIEGDGAFRTPGGEGPGRG